MLDHETLDLSIVVPCFNECDCALEFYKRMSSACRKAPVTSYEIIFVNDGSSDATLAILLDIQRNDPTVRVADLSRNYGHQIASTAGLALSRGRMVLLIDADLQDPPELLGKMIGLLEQGADVVYGQRVVRRGESVMKRMTASLFYRLLARSSNVAVPLDTGDFRLMRRNVVDVLNEMGEAHRFLRGMVSWVGFNQVALPYERDPRYAGVTKYPFFKMLNLSLDAITAFATAPLRYVFVMAMGSVVIALGMLAWTIYSYFYLNTVAGWSSLMAVFLLFTSVQLFSLAIIGEYVGRTFLESKKRPLYATRHIYQSPSTSQQRMHKDLKPLLINQGSKAPA
jgi:polyisoprenyl-phosphate glycosyltransferase